MKGNDEHADHLTFREGVSHFRDLAQEKGLQDSVTIKEAICDMETIGKEIALLRSGSIGERSVKNAVRYASRKVIAVPNVILHDDEGKTELDLVLITSNGILALEVKNYKGAVTIAENGRIYSANHNAASDRSVGEQLQKGRFLLKKKIEDEMAVLGLPTYIESRIVFSHPSVSVTDNYKLELYCFTASLPKAIDDFTSGVLYSYNAQ